MIIEKDVEMTGVCDQLKNILPIIEHVLYETGNTLVITAAKWGKDPFRNSHETGCAIDIMKPPHREADTLYKLKDAIGLNYKIMQVHTHWHIVFEPIDEVAEREKKNRHERREAATKKFVELPGIAYPGRI